MNGRDGRCLLPPSVGSPTIGGTCTSNSPPLALSHAQGDDDDPRKPGLENVSTHPAHIRKDMLNGVDVCRVNLDRCCSHRGASGRDKDIGCLFEDHRWLARLLARPAFRAEAPKVWYGPSLHLESVKHLY